MPLHISYSDSSQQFAQAPTHSRTRAAETFPENMTPAKKQKKQHVVYAQDVKTIFHEQASQQIGQSTSITTEPSITDNQIKNISGYNQLTEIPGLTVSHIRTTAEGLEQTLHLYTDIVSDLVRQKDPILAFVGKGKPIKSFASIAPMLRGEGVLVGLALGHILSSVSTHKNALTVFVGSYKPIKDFQKIADILSRSGGDPATKLEAFLSALSKHVDTLNSNGVLNILYEVAQSEAEKPINLTH